MNLIGLKTSFKTWVRHVSQILGIYKLLVTILGYVRGFQLKIENRGHRRKRKEVISVVAQLQASTKTNVVLIVVDSLRFDRVGWHGYGESTTPFLDSMVNESIVSYKHYTVAPWTWPTVNSLVTGLYPHNHGALIIDDLKGFNRLNFPTLLPYDQTTIVDILESLGYMCKFISGVVTADLALKGIFPRDYLDQVKWEDLSFATLSEKLKKFATSNKQSGFFTYMQPGDLHMPIAVPKSYLNDEGSDWVRLDYFEHTPKVSFEDHMKNRSKYYDAALRYVDDEIRKLVEYFKQQDMYENTIFIITSDHGEEMLDHLDVEEKIMEKHKPHLIGREHGYSMFEEMVHVPFLIFGGPIHENVAIMSPTSHIDVVPSVLSILDIESDMKMDGISLLDKQDKDRYVYTESVGYGYEQKAVVNSEYKYIRSYGYDFEILENTTSKELLVGKIDELQDDRVARMREQLDEFEGKEVRKGVTTNADEKIRERLAGLGYM